MNEFVNIKKKRINKIPTLIYKIYNNYTIFILKQTYCILL